MSIMSKNHELRRRYRKLTKPSVLYPVVILFLEFFAWGLLTTPTLNQLNKTFGADTLLINGIIQGIKGFLSFLSAPLIGAFSDIKGRKPLLLITVVATCLPIPLLIIRPYWFFALLSLSGIFSVTYTIVFAYVSDITDENERNTAFGLVSATFAASLVISPAIGTLIEARHGSSLVVLIATCAAVLDVIFIYFFVPESLGFKSRNISRTLDHAFDEDEVDLALLDHEEYEIYDYQDSINGAHDTSSLNHVTTCNNNKSSNLKNITLSPDSMEKIASHRRKISWDQIDPFKSLRNLKSDKALWMISLAVFLSYMPEAGQYNSFMLYLMTMVGFSAEEVSLFIAWVGTLAVFSQVFLLTWLTNKFTQRTAILFGLLCQFAQLFIYAFTTNFLLIWLMAIFLAISSIVYPAMNGWCSLICDQDSQGVIQGIITGIRGLCMGIGPAIYGLIFHLFGVDLDSLDPDLSNNNKNPNTLITSEQQTTKLTKNIQNNIKIISSNKDQSKSDALVSEFTKTMNDFMDRKSYLDDRFMPGPPFLFAAISVFLAILVVLFIKAPNLNHFSNKNLLNNNQNSTSGKNSSSNLNNSNENNRDK